MTEIVTSPAGDRIEVWEDDDYVAKLNEPLKAIRQMNSRISILHALWECGEFTSDSGLASSMLHEKAAARGYDGALTSMSGVMRKNVMDFAIDRLINGKRVYGIQLVRLPRRWYNRLVALTPESEPEPAKPAEPEPAPEPEPEAVAAVEAAEPSIEVEPVAMPEPEVFGQLEIMQGVASALLAQVVDIVTTGKPDTDRLDRLQHDLEDASNRLSSALEEGERLRRRARLAEDEVVALKSERDGLRNRVRLAEANLAKALSPNNQRVVTALVQDELAKVMRATPTHRSPDDAPSSPFPQRPAPTPTPPNGR